MPMIKKSITVTDAQDLWLQGQLSQGRFASDSELIRALIRQEQEREEQIANLRQALKASEESGLSDKKPKDILAEVLARRAANKN